MFILEKEESDEKLLLVKTKGTYSVGRISADINLIGDPSISRIHAKLRFSETDGEAWLTDLSSKYGTYRNEGIRRNKKLKSNEEARLVDGDVVRFGGLKNIWKLQHFDINTLTSSLSKSELVTLDENVKALGGQICVQWQADCTHLTMNRAVITVKFLLALINNIPIVNSNYWQALQDYANGGIFTNPLPSPEMYPPCKPQEWDISKRPERRNLFKKKTFIFTNKRQLDKYASIIRSAGGECKDLNVGVRKAFITKPNVMVVHYTPSSQSVATNTNKTILDILEDHSLRAILEHEIGFAIIECSTEKYCNPNIKNTEILFPKLNTEKYCNPKPQSTEILFPIQNTEKYTQIIESQLPSYPATVQSTDAPISSSPVFEFVVPETELESESAKITNSEDVTKVTAKRKRSTESNTTQETGNPLKSQDVDSNLTDPPLKKCNKENILIENQVTLNAFTEPLKPIIKPQFLSKQNSCKRKHSSDSHEDTKNEPMELSSHLLTKAITANVEEIHLDLDNDEDDDEPINKASQKTKNIESEIPTPTHSFKRQKIESKKSTKANDSDDDDDLFNFGETKELPAKEEVKQEQNKLSKELSSTPLYVVPKLETTPQKIDVSGWLFCPKKELKTEPTVDVKQEDDRKENIYPPIQIHFIDLTVRPTKQQDQTDSVDTTLGKKNFKKFVKVFKRRLTLAETKVEFLTLPVKSW